MSVFYAIRTFIKVGNEGDNADRIQEFKEYLGFSETTSAAPYKVGQEKEIIEGIFSALKEKKKYYIQIVRSFDSVGLSSALLNIMNALSEKGVKIEPIKSLEFDKRIFDEGENFVYVVSEKYIDISDQNKMQVLSSLVSGIAPKEAAERPILLGLTDETLRKATRYRNKKNSETSLMLEGKQQERNGFVGAGLVLLSLPFLISSIGVIADRPPTLTLSVFTVSWIIFLASMIGILGFILVLFGSLRIRTVKARLLAISVLIIAGSELASTIIQLSSISIIKGGGFELVATSNNSFIIIPNALNLPGIYTILASFIAIGCFILIYAFAKHIVKLIALIALLAGIVAETITMLGVLMIPRDFGPLELIFFAHYLYISFYNNVTPILPYPSVMLNTVDYIFYLGKYSKIAFYSEVGLASASNLFFFVSYLLVGLNLIGRHKDEVSEYNVTIS